MHCELPTLIIATGPSGFPGAGQILSQNLREFSRIGIEARFVAQSMPFLYRFVDPLGVAFEEAAPVASGAIGDQRAIQSQDVLLSFSIAEKIIDVAMALRERSVKVIIWGTYLVPFGFAALIAKDALFSYGMSADLWLTPAGSDVWQVGVQLPNVTKQLLDNPSVTHIITYTQKFANEILAKFGIAHHIETIYPMLDFSRFHPVSDEIKLAIRQELGIPMDAFVIISHSNMRPVKRPDDVISISSRVAESISRDVTLLMVGPKAETRPADPPSYLRVIRTGIVEHVERFIAASDAELNCSWHDSFNVSLAESMACGLPCVSTDVVGIGEEIAKADAGFLFPYEDLAESDRSTTRYSSAVEFLNELSRSEPLRTKLGKNASEHAAKAFAASTIMPKYMNLIHSK